jgi:AhpD family alkylhydroperoxidase
VHLVKVRVSLINGCGYCIDMHTKDARVAGETEQRLYLLGAWREATVYSERERAALAWADAVTKLENQRVDDATYDAARAAFSESELVALTLAVAEINAWNRFSISFQRAAGDYMPGQFAQAR